jgi:hypothetical protein
MERRAGFGLRDQQAQREGAAGVPAESLVIMVFSNAEGALPSPGFRMTAFVHIAVCEFMSCLSRVPGLHLSSGFKKRNVSADAAPAAKLPTKKIQRLAIFARCMTVRPMATAGLKAPPEIPPRA